MKEIPGESAVTDKIYIPVTNNLPINSNYAVTIQFKFKLKLLGKRHHGFFLRIKKIGIIGALMGVRDGVLQKKLYTCTNLRLKRISRS